MKLLISIIICLSTLSAFPQKNETDTIMQGIHISFDYKINIFPGSWREEPINAEGEQIEVSEIARCKSIMKKAFSKYPITVLKQNLKAVYFLKSIRFYNVGYGGTNSTDALYLTNDGIPLGYTDWYLEKSFHHEFSSILYRNHPEYINETEWKKANITGFDYNDPEGGVGAIRNNKSSEEIDTTLCRNGFLTQYALSDMENDINTFAQNIFIPAAGFWEAADKYPRIKRKLNLIIGFYHKLNPLFTEAYFRSFQ